MSDLREYWAALGATGKKRFAERSGYSPDYINIHLIHKRKTPPLQAIHRLAKASNGKLTYHGLCDFFLDKDKGLKP